MGHYGDDRVARVRIQSKQEFCHSCHLHEVAIKRLINLVWLYFKNMMQENQMLLRKIQSEMEGYNRLLTSNDSSVTLLFQNNVMFLLKITLIYDKALLSGQPPLSGNLSVPRGRPFNWGSTVLLGTLRNLDGDVNGNVKKSISFNEHNNNFARASRLFVNFIQLQTWQGRILRSLENGNRARR